MMRFIPSSFIIGVAFSGYFSTQIYYGFEKRRWICYENYEDELIAYYYQQKLKQKMYRKQNKADNPTVNDLKKYINNTVIPSVVDKVDSAFASFRSGSKVETSVGKGSNEEK